MIDIYSLAKNPLVFQKQRTITSAYIDVSGKMGIAQTVLMVQDNFTENFGALKMDNFCVNEKGGYWAIYKAKFKFFQRPYWRDKVVTTSFPADNAPIRTYENTAVTTVDGEPIILAVQEACCLDLERHRPMKLSAVDFPTEGAPEPFMDNKFTKLSQMEIDSVVRIKELASVAGNLVCWGMTVQIPATLFGLKSFDGIVLKGNLYKCADKAKTPHYLSAFDIETEKPDFHRPEFFREF